MDFLKRSSVGYVSKAGFERVREKASIFARTEGFEAHALAAEERK
jgi:histidinol dehydrogenase